MHAQFVFLLPFNDCNLPDCNLCDFTKHFAAHFAHFALALFLLVLTTLCFQHPNIFFHVRKQMEKYKEETSPPPPPLEIFCSMLPIMHGVDSYSVSSKYLLTIKKPCLYAFYGPPDFRGLAAQLNRWKQNRPSQK